MRRVNRYVPLGVSVVDTKIGGPIVNASNHLHARALCRGLNAYEYAVITLRAIATNDDASEECKELARKALAAVKEVIQ